MAVTGNTSRIENALLYRLSTLTLSPVRRIAQPQPAPAFKPVKDEIYLAPATLWNRSERGEVGSLAARRHVGIFQVNVRGPAVAASPEPQAEVADAIIEWFDMQVITRNSVTVRIGSFTGGPGVPWRGGSISDGAWSLIPVSIPFWCDVFPA